jgi:hypothetical protein
MILQRAQAGWRQWRFPREFRIKCDEPIELAEVLSDLAAAILTAPPPAPAPAPAPVTEPAPKTATVAALEQGFVIELCNELYRLRRNTQALARGGTETKETRSINRAVEHVEDALRQRGAEYFDKTGKPFDPRDPEFEPRGQPVAVPGILQGRIGPCECPVVKLSGTIIQRARGLVEVPAPRSE